MDDNNGRCVDGTGNPVIVPYWEIDIKQRGEKLFNRALPCLLLWVTGPHEIVQTWQFISAEAPSNTHTHTSLPPPLSSFTLTDFILPPHPLFLMWMWPEPQHVQLPSPNRIIAHISGSFMHLNSPVQRLRLWLFPKGFIRLQCFYLKLAGRTVAF